MTGEILSFILGVVGSAVALFLKRWFDKRAAADTEERDKRVAADEEGQRRCDQLRNLQVMLRDSASIFRDQNYKARQLMRSLQRRLPDRIGPDGYEANFRSLYDEFTEDEKELFDLIRGATITTLHSANTRARSWLHDNAWARSGGVSDRLRSELDQLQIHLDTWLASYEIALPNMRVGLVYMADEKKKGTGFPRDLESVLDSYVSQTCD